MFEGITFKVADRRERTEALAIRRRIYEIEFHHGGVDAFDRKAPQLIAKRGRDIVAAFRMIRQRPLEIER